MPIPATGLGKSDFSYIASDKDLFRQAKDLVKFIPQKAGVSAGMKEEVKKIYEEIEQATQDILYYCESTLYIVKWNRKETHHDRQETSRTFAATS